MNSTSQAETVVRGYIAAFFSGNLDIEKVRTYLSPTEFTFKGPLMTAESSNDYLKQLKAMGPISLKAEVKGLLAGATEVAATLEFITPFGNFPASEWYRVKDGKIVSINLYNDPRPFLAAFGG